MSASISRQMIKSRALIIFNAHIWSKTDNGDGGRHPCGQHRIEVGERMTALGGNADARDVYFGGRAERLEV